MTNSTRILMLAAFSLVVIACNQTDPAETAYRNSLTASAYNNRLDAIESELQGSQGVKVDDPSNIDATLAQKDMKSLNRIRALIEEYITDAFQANDYGSRPGVVVIGRQELRNKMENAKAIHDSVVKRLTANPPT